MPNGGEIRNNGSSLFDALLPRRLFSFPDTLLLGKLLGPLFGSRNARDDVIERVFQDFHCPDFWGTEHPVSLTNTGEQEWDALYGSFSIKLWRTNRG
jgi:hypothetical protein